MNKENYASLGAALVKLLGPFIEVVIHDLTTGKIAFIEGGLSSRQVGDPSLLDDSTQLSLEELSQPYSKINYDGRLLKSISIPLKDQGKLVALFCVNYDTSAFKELHTLTSLLLNHQQHKQPEALFNNDWQEKIHQFIHQFLQGQALQFTTLTNKNKKEIVCRLYQHGAFAEKHAADYIAKILNTSRATIFNYLKTIRDTHVSHYPHHTPLNNHANL